MDLIGIFINIESVFAISETGRKIVMTINYIGGPEKGRLFNGFMLGVAIFNLQIRTGYVLASLERRRRPWQ